MNPEDLFKQFFGASFNDPRHPGTGEDESACRENNQWGVFGGSMQQDFFEQFDRQMEEMERHMRDVFQIFQHPGRSIIFEDGSGNRRIGSSKESPRDKMLKDGYAAPSPSPDIKIPDAQPVPNMDSFLSQWMKDFGVAIPRWNRSHPEEYKDTDLDSQSLSSAEIADLLKDPKPKESKEITTKNKPFGFFGGSHFSFQETTVGPDGRVEERRTVRDSSGREETTVTRRIGDSSHTVSTKRDKEGCEEKKEVFNNIDKDKMMDFEKQWQEKRTLEDFKSDLPIEPSTPRGGVLSDNNRGIFYKLFGLK